LPTGNPEGSKKEGPQGIGRSRGGLTTKIYAAGGGLSNPVCLLLTGGEVADITQAQALIDGFEAMAIVADKGYDSDAFVISISFQNTEAAIPSRRNRIIAREYGRHVYKDRNLVERIFNRLKQFRRLATRYEELARRFLAMLHLVFAFICLQ
jgi:transposase